MCDLLIVGAGPAGSAAAITAARFGLAVTLVDKSTFPRDKCCGDGLTTLALRQLEDLGLRPEAVPQWFDVDGAWLRSPSGREVFVPLPNDGRFAAIAPRLELDDALVRRAREVGVKVLESRAFTDLEQNADRVIVTFDDDGIIEVEHRALDRVRFAEIEVPVGDHEDLDALERALEDAAGAAVEEADGRLILVRARLTGSGPLYSDLSAEHAAEELRRALDAGAPAQIVWERIMLEATAPIDLDALRSSAGLEGDLVRAFDLLAGDPERLAAVLEELEALLPERSVRGIAADDPEARLASARSLALDLLLRARGAA